MNEKEISDILDKIERKKFFRLIQTQAEKERHISPAPFLLLKKLGNVLQYTGGILLGIFSGIFVLLLIYILVVYLLHLQL